MTSPMHIEADFGCVRVALDRFTPKPQPYLAIHLQDVESASADGHGDMAWVKIRTTTSGDATLFVRDRAAAEAIAAALLPVSIGDAARAVVEAAAAQMAPMTLADAGAPGSEAAE